MGKISAKNVLYIKLGRRGEWKKDCLYNNKGSLKIGFREVNHSDCLNGNWESISNCYLKEGKSKGTASDFQRQVRSFYEEPEDTLWITFADKRMWWCFAEKEVQLNEDKTKIRYVTNDYPWSDKDIKGIPLDENLMNGELCSVQSYQGTICKVPNKEYVINKINNNIPKYILEAKNEKEIFEKKLSLLIRKLNPKELELLVDLIFRHAGWKRNTPIGGIASHIDIDLTTPITNERVAVQVKSKSSVKEFQAYVEIFATLSYDKYFYFVSNDNNFLKYQNDTPVKLILLKELTQYVMDAGLTDWVIKRVF